MQRLRARLYRDPVHDTINWKDEGAVGGVISALIDTPEMQRLRHVRQLGMAASVFHGAEHSRFAHSLGVAHLARRMLARIAPDADESTRLTVAAAALLHDIGHAPFSHVLERVFGFHHEGYSRALIEDEHSAVSQVLRSVDPQLPAAVSSLVAGKGPGAHAAIISSQLDADRCDYLLRDAHMTGVAVGRFDLERILVTLHADERGLLVDLRSWEAVEGYLLARYHMYRLVYFHRTVRAAETMLERMFARARMLSERGEELQMADAHPALVALMEGRDVAPSQWARFAEFHAWTVVDRWREHDDLVLRTLASGLLERRLLKGWMREVGDAESLERDDALVTHIRANLSEAEGFLFAVDDANHAPYRPYVAGGQSSELPLRLIDRSGRIRVIEEVSPIARTLGETAMKLRRWYVHPLIADRVRQLEREFGAG